MRVWLDDSRPMPESYTHHAKTADEAIELLKTGQVKTISLDHDLGDFASEVEKTGYTVAKFIEQGAINGTLSKLKCLVHTQNPVGRANICSAIRKAYAAWDH